MWLVVALVLVGVSILWYVGIARVLAVQWTQRSGATVAPPPGPVSAGPPPDSRSLGLEGVLPAVPEVFAAPDPRLGEPDASAPCSLGLEPAAPPSAAPPVSFSPPAPYPAYPPPAPVPAYPPPPPSGPPTEPLPLSPAAPTRARPASVSQGRSLRLPRPDLARLFGWRAAPPAPLDALLLAAAGSPVLPTYAWPVVVDREFRVDYTRRVYLNQACYIIVRIGPENRDLAPLTLAEQQVLVATASQRLRFAAPEPEPRVQVALQFAEGTFYATRTTAEGVLTRDQEARFVFVVKPLKGEDSVLTIVVSYVEMVTEPEHVAQRVVIERTIRLPGGEERHEQEEQRTYAPAAPVAHLHPVLTTERVIAVKSLLRLNAAELGLIQKGAGLLLTVLLLLLGVQQGQGLDLPYIIMALAPLLGIPLGAVAQQLFKAASD